MENMVMKQVRICSLIFLMQWNLLHVHCNTTVSVQSSVTLQPLGSGVIFTGVATTNINTATVSARLDASSTNAFINIAKSQPTSLIDQITIASSVFNQPVLTFSLLEESSFLKQSTSLINEIVPTKTIVSESFSKESKSLSDVSQFTSKNENSLSVSAVTISTNVKQFETSSKIEEISMQDKISSETLNIYSSSSFITNLPKDSSQITSSSSSSSLGVEIIPASTSLLAVMTSISNPIINTASLIHSSSTSEARDFVTTNKAISSGAVENSQTMTISTTNIVQTAQNSDQNIMSSIISGEITISKSVLLSETAEDSKSTERVEISTFLNAEQTSIVSEHSVLPSISAADVFASSIPSSSTNHHPVFSSIIDTSELIAPTSVIVTKSSTNATTIFDNMDSAQNTYSSEIIQTSATYSHNIVSSNFPINLFSSSEFILDLSSSSTSYWSSLELTKIDSTNSLSSVELMPSETVPSLTVSSFSDFNMNSFRSDSTDSHSIKIVTSSIDISMSQSNHSDFETHMVLSSSFEFVTSADISIFSSTSVSLSKTQSPISSIELTPQNSSSVIFSTDMSIETPQTVASQSNTPIFSTYSLLPTTQLNTTFSLTETISTDFASQSSPTSDLSTHVDFSTQIITTSEINTQVSASLNSSALPTSSGQLEMNITSQIMESSVNTFLSSVEELSPLLTSSYMLSSYNSDGIVLSQTVPTNVTQSDFSSTVTKNYTDILATHSVSFLSMSTIMAQLTSEIAQNITTKPSVEFNISTSFPFTSSFFTTSDLSFSPLTSVGSALSSNFSYSMPIFKSSSPILEFSEANNMTYSSDFFNFSSSVVEMVSTFTFNLTTQPITTLDLQTPIMSESYHMSTFSKEYPNFSTTAFDMPSSFAFNLTTQPITTPIKSEALNFSSFSTEFFNFSTTAMGMTSSLTFNLTTQPITTLDLQTPIISETTNFSTTAMEMTSSFTFNLTTQPITTLDLQTPIISETTNFSTTAIDMTSSFTFNLTTHTITTLDLQTPVISETSNFSTEYLNFSTTAIDIPSTISFNLTTQPISTLDLQTPVMSEINNLSTYSQEFFNFSTTVIEMTSTFTFNLTTQPITISESQTSFMTDLVNFTSQSEMPSSLQTDSLQTFNMSASDVSLELSTMSQSGNGTLSVDFSMTSVLVNITTDSTSFMSEYQSTLVTSLPILQSSSLVNSSMEASTYALETSSVAMETLFNMTVVSTPTVDMLSTSIILSTTEISNESAIGNSTSYVASSVSMETNSNTTFVIPASSFVSTTSQMPVNLTTTRVESTMAMNSSNEIFSSMQRTILIGSSSVFASVAESSAMYSSELTPQINSTTFTSTAFMTSQANVNVTESTVGSAFSSSIALSSIDVSSLIEKTSQSISAFVTMSTTLSSVSNLTTESLVASTSTISPVLSTIVTEIKSSFTPTSTSVIAATSSLSSVVPSAIKSSSTPTSTSVIAATSSLASVMSSSVSMTTVSTTIPTTQPTTTPTTTTPTTTTPTTPPKPTTPDVVSTYWVKTGIIVPLTEDVSTTTFKVSMENGLAKAYDLAFQRQQQPGKRRRKRYAQIGQAGINVTEITRDPGTTDVTVGYTVDKNGSPLPAADAVAAANTISDQMMAIKLGYEVSSKAETYVATQQTTSDEPSKWWIVGVVIGAVAFVVIVIWIVVCIIYCKYKRAPSHKTLDTDVDPPLLRMKSPTGEEEDEEKQQYDKINAQETSETPAYTVTSPKKQKYKVNQDEDLYAEVKKPKHPSPSKSPEKIRPDGDSVDVITENGEKKKKKKTGRNIKKSNETVGNLQNGDYAKTIPCFDKLFEGKVAGLEDPAENTPKLIRTTHLKGYEPQIDEDLQESMDAERKKNKQRLREKRKKKEKEDAITRTEDTMKQYLSGQDEIDAVLGKPLDEIPDVFIHKPKKKKGAKEKTGEQNDGYVEDESLREARKRMHRLLDDAFSLIPSTDTTNGDERRPSLSGKPSPSVSPLRKFTHRNKISPESSQSKEGDEVIGVHILNTEFELNGGKLNTEKKHEPMHVQTKHTPKPEGLQTWSPYRAADQAALIAMPHSMQTSLGRDAHRKSPGKRPVANLKYNGNTLATESPKPIILRTRELEKNGGTPEHNRSTKLSDIGSSNSTNLAGLRSSHIGKTKNDPQQSIEMKNLNGSLSHSQPHRPPSMVPKDTDETDIATDRSGYPDDFPEKTLASIRDELRNIVNSSKTQPKSNSSLADIS